MQIAIYGLCLRFARQIANSVDLDHHNRIFDLDLSVQIPGVNKIFFYQMEPELFEPLIKYLGLTLHSAHCSSHFQIKSDKFDIKPLSPADLNNIFANSVDPDEMAHNELFH